jgi:hypothetical protein
VKLGVYDSSQANNEVKLDTYGSSSVNSLVKLDVNDASPGVKLDSLWF